MSSGVLSDGDRALKGKFFMGVRKTHREGRQRVMTEF